MSETTNTLIKIAIGFIIGYIIAYYKYSHYIKAFNDKVGEIKL